MECDPPDDDTPMPDVKRPRPHYRPMSGVEKKHRPPKKHVQNVVSALTAV